MTDAQFEELRDLLIVIFAAVSLQTADPGRETDNKRALIKQTLDKLGWPK